MEPFEWLVLGVGLVLGGVFGSKGKGILKTAAKGYIVAGEKAQEWSANIREDFRDAIEEARYEKEQEELLNRQESEQYAYSTGAVEPPAKHSSKGSHSSNSHSSEHGDGASTNAKSQSSSE